MSRADEVFGLLRGLRDQFNVLDDLVRGFRDRQGWDRRRRWEARRQAALAAVTRAQRRRARRGAEAVILASGGSVLVVAAEPGWTWLAVPTFALSALRVVQVRTAAVPQPPALDESGPVVLPDAPRTSRAFDPLRRAAAARDAIDTILPLLQPSGVAEVVAETRDSAERAVADLGRGVLGLEQMTRHLGAPTPAHASLDRLAGELERAVVAVEDLATTVAQPLTGAASTAQLAEFEARLAGVRAVLQTLHPSPTER